MPFSEEIKRKAMVACGRRCCICHKFCGNNMEVHHIKPQANGGEDTFDNAIPLCFDCHAEVGQYNPNHPKGIKFTEAELKEHRDNWYKKVVESDADYSHILKTTQIKISHKKGSNDFLRRIRTGDELFACCSHACAMEHSYDSPKTSEEAKLISGFFQEVSDLIDSDAFDEPFASITYAFEWNEKIQELEESGFWLFAMRDIRQVVGGVFPPGDFPVVCLRIVRESNPDIMKTEVQK